MSKRKSVLPMVGWWCGAYGDQECNEAKRLHAELRAAEAVIRAAMKAGPYVSMKDDVAMGRALARLDRVTGRAT